MLTQHTPSHEEDEVPLNERPIFPYLLAWMAIIAFCWWWGYSQGIDGIMVVDNYTLFFKLGVIGFLRGLIPGIPLTILFWTFATAYMWYQKEKERRACAARIEQARQNEQRQHHRDHQGHDNHHRGHHLDAA